MQFHHITHTTSHILYNFTTFPRNANNKKHIRNASNKSKNEIKDHPDDHSKKKATSEARKENRRKLIATYFKTIIAWDGR